MLKKFRASFKLGTIFMKPCPNIFFEQNIIFKKYWKPAWTHFFKKKQKSKILSSIFVRLEPKAKKNFFCDSKKFLEQLDRRLSSNEWIWIEVDCCQSSSIQAERTEVGFSWPDTDFAKVSEGSNMNRKSADVFRFPMLWYSGYMGWTNLAVDGSVEWKDPKYLERQ